MSQGKEFEHRLKELTQQEENQTLAVQRELEEKRKADELKSQKWEEEKPIRLQRLFESASVLGEILEKVNENYLNGRGEIEKRIDEEEADELTLKLNWDVGNFFGNRITLTKRFNFHTGLKEYLTLGVADFWIQSGRPDIDLTATDWLEEIENGIIEAITNEECYWEHIGGPGIVSPNA